MIWVRCGLAAVSALLYAPQAIAGDATCLWRHLPVASQNQVLAAYATQGRNSLDELNISNAEVVASLQACGVSPPTDALGVEAVGAALAGVALQLGSAEALADAGVASSERLSAVWTGLGPAKREALESVFLDTARRGEGGPAPEAAAILEEAVRKAGWTPKRPHADRIHQLLFDHYQGRAQQEAFSRLF
jgi:hypothetical protein